MAGRSFAVGDVHGDLAQLLRSMERPTDVHAGLPQRDGVFPHPRDVDPPTVLLWPRTERFSTDYRGKRAVVGHTMTGTLPQELSSHSPADPTDLWAVPAVAAIDTGCGKGGFLTALEPPALRVDQSR
jgi:serine/threonine protein phosphatase 1